MPGRFPETRAIFDEWYPNSIWVIFQLFQGQTFRTDVASRKQVFAIGLDVLDGSTIGRNLQTAGSFTDGTYSKRFRHMKSAPKQLYGSLGTPADAVLDLIKISIPIFAHGANDVALVSALGN